MSEIFDPKKEVKKISFETGKETPLERESRRIAYEDFLQKRNEQKKGIAELSKVLINAVEEDHDIDKKILINIVQEYSLRFGFSKYQNDKFSSIVNQFLERRAKIKEGLSFIKRQEKDLSFYEDAPFAIHKWSSDKDYKETGAQEGSAGFYHSGGLITHGKEAHRNSDVKTHEQTHAMKDIIDRAFGRDIGPDLIVKHAERAKSIVAKSSNLINGAFHYEEDKRVSDYNQKETFLSRAVTALARLNGERIKNEIFAYTRGHEKHKMDNERTGTVLKKEKFKNGLYDYLADDMDAMKQKIVEFSKKNNDTESLSWVENRFDEIFRTEYKVFIDRAVNSIKKLQDVDFSSEEMIGLLYDIPIEKWPAEVRRMGLSDGSK